nr:hypothetical protein [uncultured Desulfobacter sp.]
MKKMIFASACALFLLFFAGTTGAESWLLNVSYSLSGSMYSISTNTRAKGRVRIEDDGKGNFTGTGRLSVTEKGTGPYIVLQASGSGVIYATGRRDGANLAIQIKGPSIPLNGTSTVMGEAQPHKSSFQPSSCTPSEILIERKQGALSSQKVDVPGFAVQADIRFTLSDGINIVKQIEAPDPQNALPEDVWTLELEARNEYSAGGMNITGHDSFKGKLKFVRPFKDGPVAGKGPMTNKGSFKVTSPYPGTSDYNTDCVLILEGRVEKDVLIFTPKAKIKQTHMNQSLAGKSVSASANAGQGISLFRYAEEIRIPMENGQEYIDTVSQNDHGMKTTGNWIWRLKGKKIDKYRLTIDDYYTDYLLHEGSGTDNKRCGLKVHTRRIVDVVIEDKKFKSAQGTSRFVSIKPFANPPWAYEVKHLATQIPGTGSDIDYDRADQVKWAGRFNPPKTQQDARLKKQWEKIRKNKTPYIYPEKFRAKGALSGNQLKLWLPSKSGYTVSIYWKLNTEAIKKRGKTIGKDKLRENMGLKIRPLETLYSVPLIDGWQHENAPSTALERTCLGVVKTR